jgi:putative transposase
VGRTVRDLIRQLCAWRRFDILAGRVMVDHIHMVLTIPPKYSVSEAVGFLKGKSAIKIFDLHRPLKKRYWGRHFWAKGYCVSTVGLDEEQIKRTWSTSWSKTESWKNANSGTKRPFQGHPSSHPF